MQEAVRVLGIYADAKLGRMFGNTDKYGRGCAMTWEELFEKVVLKLRRQWQRALKRVSCTVQGVKCSSGNMHPDG